MENRIGIDVVNQTRVVSIGETVLFVLDTPLKILLGELVASQTGSKTIALRVVGIIRHAIAVTGYSQVETISLRFEGKGRFVKRSGLDVAAVRSEHSGPPGQQTGLLLRRHRVEGLRLRVQGAPRLP